MSSAKWISAFAANSFSVSNFHCSSYMTPQEKDTKVINIPSSVYLIEESIKSKVLMWGGARLWEYLSDVGRGCGWWADELYYDCLRYSKNSLCSERCAVFAVWIKTQEKYIAADSVSKTYVKLDREKRKRVGNCQLLFCNKIELLIV